MPASPRNANVVFASATTTAGLPDGTPYTLIEGQAWAADDPLVRANPGLFVKDISELPGYPRRTVAVVESATAAPGERRSVKRG